MSLLHSCFRRVPPSPEVLAYLHADYLRHRANKEGPQEAQFQSILGEDRRHGSHRWLRRGTAQPGLHHRHVPVAQSSDEPVFLDAGFVVSAELVNALSEARALRQHRIDPLELEHDAFMLDPGLGPATYLCRDGRVLWVDWYWWSRTPPTIKDAYMSIVAGSCKTKVVELLELLPPRPASAKHCSDCKGKGYGEVPCEPEPMPLICGTCGGLGWSR